MIRPPAGRSAARAAGLSLPAALLFLCLLAASALSAALLPLTGRVVDTADLIDAATETALVSRLEAFEARSSDQIVVATIAALDGDSIEDFANRQFRAWGLGTAGDNNGILLLVARDDRRMRIEVGYGLEGTLTDLHARLIIENTMVPAFRAGDFSGGISRAVDDIIMVLEGNGAELEARARRNQSEADDIPFYVPIFIVLWCMIFFGAFGMAFLAPIYGKKLGPNRYRWLGMDIHVGGRSSSRGGSLRRGGWSSSGGGGFSGGGGSSGGGGASGGW